MKEVVYELIKRHQTIATMESCTGGSIVNEITNVEGSSSVLQFSAVTYANSFKIKMGVSQEVIDTYSVYSMETARQMSYHIALFADSDYGIGVTGKLNRVDENNLVGEDNVVYIAVYEKETGKYYEKTMRVYQKRKENKEQVVFEVIHLLKEILHISQASS